MQRTYYNIIKHHLDNWDQMVFIEGPRQAGKTTLAKQLLSEYKINKYFNWDNLEDRRLILSGPSFIEKMGLLDVGSRDKPLIVLDEIHKLPSWKNYLKGFYDTYKDRLKIIATGSAKLSVYKKGQDSLMGRYFSYLIHPITVRESITTTLDQAEIQKPIAPNDELYQNLITYGGFPDPYLKASKVFHNKWLQLRFEQLFREDILTVEEIKNISQLEVLAYILTSSATQQTNYTDLAKKIQVSDQTIRKWISMLELFYFGYLIRPWSRNITRAILKEPKFYLWDWSAITDPGARAENFIASHLKKATSFWSDRGLGKFDLLYIRTKDGKEVDFIITKNNDPWFLVEAKNSKVHSLNKNLYHFQEQTEAKHAFQVVIDMQYDDIDCFSYTKPVIVPAKTFLSQLV